MSRSTRLVLTSAFFFTISGPPLATADDSGPAVVDILKKAHDANLDRYPAGKMRVIVHKGQRDPSKLSEERHEYREVQLQWSGDEIRTDLVDRGMREGVPDASSTVVGRETYILDRTRSISTNYRSTVIIEPIAGKVLSPEYSFTPKLGWYLSQIHPDYPCIKAFLPGKGSPISAPGATFQMENIADGEVRLTMRKPLEHSSLTTSYSYHLDGNVTEFFLDNPDGGPKIRGKFDWKRDPLGRVYLTKLDRTVNLRHKSRPIEMYEVYEVTEFDPSFRPSKDVFQIRSLKLRAGTMVEDRLSGRRYRTGDLPVESVAEKLDDLIPTLRSTGFSTPGRP